MENHPFGGEDCDVVVRRCMVTPRQIRAARALLGWSQQELADRAVVSVNALARLEKQQVDSRMSTMSAVQQVLIRAGIEFLDDPDVGEGVRLRHSIRNR